MGMRQKTTSGLSELLLTVLELRTTYYLHLAYFLKAFSGGGGIGSKILVDIEHVLVFELYYPLVFGLVRLLCTAAQNVIAHMVLWVIVPPMALM